MVHYDHFILFIASRKEEEERTHRLEPKEYPDTLKAIAKTTEVIEQERGSESAL